MKTILLVALYLTGLATYGQKVENVSGIQAGDNVLVTYDLVDDGSEEYYVRLLYSDDGGISYSDELDEVTGDVKSGVAPGSNKKIIWDAKQEVGSFAGEMVFKVEALTSAASAGVVSGLSAENKCLKVEINEIDRDGYNVKVGYTVTPINGNSTIYMSAYVSNTYLQDMGGNKYKMGEGFLAGTPKGRDKAVLNGVPYEGYAVFEGVPPSTDRIGQLTIYIGAQAYQSGACAQNDAQAAFSFNDVRIP